MMSGGEFKSSLVQQTVWSGGTVSSNAMSRGSCADKEQQEASTKMPSALSSPSMLFPHQLLHLSSGLVPEVNSVATSPASLHGGQESSMPESWSQLLLGGLVGDHERYSSATALLSKGLEEGPMAQAASAYDFYGHGEEIQASGGKTQLSQMLLVSSSPRSCVTTSLGGNMLDFSNSAPAPAPAPAPEPRNHQSDNSAESNSNATGSASKKARLQASSSAQSTLKVRKERLGDRVTALHQIVSPFGKTDTASVLQETIGYIRFLLGQIEALSYPYLGHVTGDSMHQQTGPAGEKNPGLFPEFPGQLLNHSNDTTEAGQTEQGAKDGEDGAAGKKDLRSRGLCLVPVSCTSYLAADNGSDFWAPALAPAPPLPIGGIILR